jgi:hypothetical protein
MDNKTGKEELQRRAASDRGSDRTTKQLFEHLLSLTSDESVRQMLQKYIQKIEQRNLESV